jgi:hypothetical protein
MYLCEPIKRLLGQLILFAVLLQVSPYARPDALKLFNSGRHLELKDDFGLETGGHDGTGQGAIDMQDQRAEGCGRGQGGEGSNFRGEGARAVLCCVMCCAVARSVRVGRRDVQPLFVLCAPLV